jgi:hypothetical protein
MHGPGSTFLIQEVAKAKFERFLTKRDIKLQQIGLYLQRHRNQEKRNSLSVVDDYQVGANRRLSVLSRSFDTTNQANLLNEVVSRLGDRQKMSQVRQSRALHNRSTLTMQRLSQLN